MTWASGVKIHAVCAGPPDGRPIFLLHGFPEFWYSWRHQMPALAGAGFRVIAPDQRGYNLSAKPAGISSYRIDRLSGDVAAIADRLGYKTFAVAGHDWGAAVAWWTAANYPERLSRLIILNVPHWQVMQESLRHDLRQLLKSWYILYFQIPWLPERMSRAGNFRMMANALVQTSRKGTFSEEDLQCYRQSWSQPGAIQSMIHWYRAAARRIPDEGVSARISVPTLILWGLLDHFLEASMAEKSLSLCQQGRLVALKPPGTGFTRRNPNLLTSR